MEPISSHDQVRAIVPQVHKGSTTVTYLLHSQSGMFVFRKCDVSESHRETKLSCNICVFSHNMTSTFFWKVLKSYVIVTDSILYITRPSTLNDAVYLVIEEYEVTRADNLIMNGEIFGILARICTELKQFWCSPSASYT